MDPKSQWSFITSPRFWALVIGAVALALWQDGIISQGWVTCVATITGGFITVRTVDRFGERIGGVNAQQINVEAPKPSDQNEV